MFLLLLILLFIIPSSIILLLIWLITKKKVFARIAGYLWLGFFSFITFLFILSAFTEKMTIDKDDIYGNYIIDRDKCPGKQADWQYNRYRFKITKDNKIFFYITENEKIIKTIEGKIEINEIYTPSPRLKIIFEEPKFHITQDNPTLYRDIWSFYYVFYSPKYQNVFFKKGEWKPIN